MIHQSNIKNSLSRDLIIAIIGFIIGASIIGIFIISTKIAIISGIIGIAIASIISIAIVSKIKIIRL